jgi:hypothetical protein
MVDPMESATTTAAHKSEAFMLRTAQSNQTLGHEKLTYRLNLTTDSVRLEINKKLNTIKDV